ncbi:serine/threonine protein kinase [Bacteroides caecigallinarum]|uniref:serine/threonine protein kinase n=1 Tax=Bacteroides caecigallinarum TaxID=1411144 RepID=UPI00195A1089|nr:serine/threonine-protein kinase [Bacteroides caecigallinarum]MBM6882265.1 serine/threonine protein kinase [Bacteroides caecigallinarum]
MNNTNDNALKPGTLLRGKSYTYTIQKVLGQGTFGITYLATTQIKVTGALGEIDTTIQVAIKEFFMKEVNGRKENTVTTGSQGGIYANYKKKFAREAENLSKLHHPNIVRVLEFFEANNTVYYAMEYVDGGSLDKYIKPYQGIPESEALKQAKQIGAALSYMHTHKMLHLDLKPGNIMLRKNGDIVLIDFGLSKQYDKNGEPESSTSVGNGTPGYAPIEQANYHEGKDFPVTMDVYAFGATLFKMLTGVPPLKADEILNEGFPAYELQKHQVSNSLIACIAKAMSSMKKDRPQSVEAFLQELTGMKSQKIPQEVSPTTKPQIERKEKEPLHPHSTPNFWGKYKKPIIGASTCALIICVFLIVKSINKQDIKPDIMFPQDSIAVAEVIEETHDSPDSIATTAPETDTASSDSIAVEVETKEERFQKAMKLQGKNKENALLQLADEGYAYAYFPLAEYYFSTQQNKQADKWLAKSLLTGKRHEAERLIEKKISSGDFGLVNTMRMIENQANTGHEEYYCLLAKWYLGRNEDTQADKWLRKAIAAGINKKETRQIEQTLRERGFYD